MTDPVRRDVTVVRRVTFSPWWGGLNRFVEEIARALPSHRDSKSGRRNAAQVRAGFLVVGILTVVFWESALAALGFVLIALAFLIPVSENRRRGWVASLKAARTNNKRLERSPGVLEISGTHVSLFSGDERLRHLRLKSLQAERSDNSLELRSGGKKVEQLTLTTASIDDRERDLWVEMPQLPELPS